MPLGILNSHFLSVPFLAVPDARKIYAPQLGQSLCNSESAQSAQKVYTQEKMTSSVQLAAKSLSKNSHLGLSTSMRTPYELNNGKQPVPRAITQPRTHWRGFGAEQYIR